ncbi:odorant receptor 43a isoform X2 [Daktulosphaira vitifoliae]|uniref:odorant receptor 43a isoform X2 n=1 Tax=Daktulosphaira vitifoliae TaxID=58002 RepID=UPI0021AA3357|nr:odorant receptor 43a isoform X2 [Daktulosphaira vitifoliae]XP_050535851.1 odorant receptor 43a isoform X2 [Daktulosphaira vitifoliae]
MAYMDLQLNVLKWCGMLHLTNCSSKLALKMFNIYRITIFFLVSISVITLTTQLTVTSSMLMLAKTIDMWTMAISGMYKWFCMIKFSNDFIAFDTSLVQIQTNAVLIYGSKANKFTKNHLRYTKKITVFYLLSGFIGVICIILMPLFAYFNSNQRKLSFFNDPHNYPISCWIPFTIRNYWEVAGIYTIQFITSLIVTNTYLGIDAFMFGTIYAIGGQIDLLNSVLNNFSENNTPSQNMLPISLKNENIIHQDKLYSKMVLCVKHHILILKYIRKIKNMYSSLILVDYLHGIISITFAIFQITISENFGEKMGISIFVVVSLYHQFLNNVFGEYLVHKQSNVREALYNVPWFQSDKKFRNITTFMLSRTNMQIMITGFYMYKLCINSFIKFVKALYTYYMVLRHMNQTKLVIS